MSPGQATREGRESLTGGEYGGRGGGASECSSGTGGGANSTMAVVSWSGCRWSVGTRVSLVCEPVMVEGSSVERELTS